MFKLTNGKVEVSLISWGATITGVRVAGEDVVLGFSDMAGYTSGAGRGKNPYMGAVVGRVANRIAEAKFVLDGKEYNLAKVGYTNCVYFLCSIFIFLEQWSQCSPWWPGGSGQGPVAVQCGPKPGHSHLLPSQQVVNIITASDIINY